ncbi:MAG: hypothetical protein NVS4B11_12010 [Ktedonobacteraceae bacterium]
MEYRGIIHNHSACSKEGCYPLNVLRQHWASSLDFAAMTEHAERTEAAAYALYVQECDALSDEQFRFIPGLEVATASGDMLLLGCRKFICTHDPFKVIEEAAGECVILLAHPEQGRIIPEVLHLVNGFEGWNAGHMGGYMPPFDWFLEWRSRFVKGKIMTGGNDIHKIDPRRKIVTIVESATHEEHMLLNAIRQGQFITSNGIFSFTPGGYAFYKGKSSATELSVTGRRSFAVLAQAYRSAWQGINGLFEIGAHTLSTLGIDKEKRTALNRMLRQYL